MIIRTADELESLVRDGRALKGARLERFRLDGRNLSGAILNEAQFGQCTFQRTDLTGAVLDDTVLLMCDLRLSLLAGASLRGAKIPGGAFAGADLSGADLSNCVLPEADLSGANLSGANLTGAILRGANLEGANLSQATIDVFNAGSRQQAFIRYPAIVFPEQRNNFLLDCVFGGHAAVAGLGDQDCVSAVASHESRSAETGAGAQHADREILAAEVGAVPRADSRALIVCECRHRQCDGFEIIEQPDFSRAELLL